MKRTLCYSPYLLVLLLPLFYGQTPAPYNLNSLSIEELEHRSQDKQLPREEQEAYLTALIKKAKQNKDSLRLADAYHYICSNFHAYTEKAVTYADSLIELTKHWNHKKYPAHSYLQKGIQLFALAEYSKALDNYLIAKAFFKNQKNKLGLLRIDHTIGSLKAETNQLEEALSIFKENLSFFDDKDHRIKYHYQYLKSLYVLAYMYNKLNRPDSAELFSRQGIKKSHKTKNKLYPIFLISYGEAKRLKNESDLAIDSLLKGTRLIIEKKFSKQALCEAYMEIGYVYLSKGDTLSSIAYLEKVDSIYKKEPQVIAQVEEAYSELYDLYKGKEYEKDQNKILKQLVRVETILKKRKHNDLSNGIDKVYKTSLSLSEKETVITELEKQSNNHIRWIGALVIFCIVLIIGTVFYIRRRNKIHKQRFKELMEQAESALKSKTKANGERKKEVGLPEELISEILNKLTKLEEEKGYLHQNVSVSSLAKKIKTNTNYLSKIVNTYKEKNFAQYINDLRINHAVNELKTNPTVRKYTMRALAKEFGFNTGGPFTQAFKKKTGISPLYFIEQLEKP